MNELRGIQLPSIVINSEGNLYSQPPNRTPSKEAYVWNIEPEDVHPVESHRPFTGQRLAPPPIDQGYQDSWRQLHDQIRSKNVHRNVKKFITNLKKSVTKKQVPEEVVPKLDPISSTWVDPTSQGWSPWRWDVLLVYFVEIVFSIAAIFLFTARLVLYAVKPSIFPLIYIGVIVLAAFYRLNTQVLIDDKTLVSKLAIRKNYIIWKLPVDLIVVVLSLTEYFHVATGVFRLVIFLKLINIASVLSYFEVIVSECRTGLIVWKLVSIFLLNILVAHCIALILIVMVDDDRTPNWMAAISQTRHQHDWFHAYTWAFYWATTIMLTIGFGDLTPKSPKEALIVAFVEMFSVIIFAYCINAIQSLLTSLRQYDLAKHHNLGIMNRYMKTNRVPFRLQAQVKKSVSHMTDTAKEAQVEEENSIIDELVPTVRRKLLTKVHLLALGSMSFWNRFTGASLKNIAVSLERKMYYPTEIVVTAGEVPTRLYMLQQGKLSIIINGRQEEQVLIDELSQKHFEHSKRYLWVLLEEAIRHTPSRANVKSSSHSTMLSIPVQTAMEALKDRDSDYESFCLYRDRLTVDKASVRQKTCELCLDSDHSKLQCPYYHYIPARSMVLGRYFQSAKEGTIHVRQRKQRKTQKRLTWLNSVRKPQKMRQIQRKISNKSAASHSVLRDSRASTCAHDELTTLQDVDAQYEWKLYYQKFNLSQLAPQS